MMSSTWYGFELLLFLVQIASFFFIMYPAVVGFSGMKYNKKSVAAAPKNRFAVLVCAHNEERVVGQIVKNILKSDYPKALYDLYVICDNCSDSTAATVRVNGGIAMER